MAKINLLTVNNGKVTFNNNFSEEDIKKINNQSNLKQLKKSSQEANKIVQQDTHKIGNYLNKNGQNVNINAPFSANLINNRQIMNTKNNLNGRTTLQDVIKEHKDLMNSEKGQELKNKLRLSKNERAWADYNYNQAKVNSENTTFGDKTIGTVTRGVKDLFSNMTDARDVVDENGKSIRLPSYNEMKQQKVSSNYKTGLGKFLGDASYNISKIAASSLMNIPTLGVAGSATYWGDMYFDSYNSAKNEGYSEDRAFMYALVNTSFEYITGKFLGSATKGLTGGKTSELSNAISNGINKLISNPKVSSIIGNAGSEAAEEFIQEYLDNFNRLVTLEGSKNPKDYIDVLTDKNILKDALYSAGVGAMSGGVMSGVNNVEANNVINNNNLLETFKSTLIESRDSLTNETEIAKYNQVINEINDYTSSPFGNESKVQNIIPTVKDLLSKNSTQKFSSQINNNIRTNQTNIPTVEDIVNQEKNNQNINLPTRELTFAESVKQNNINIDSATIQEIQRVMNERGINSRFDASMFDNNSLESLWRESTDNNGNTIREIIFNPNATDSNKYLQNLATHELYHDISKSQLGQEIKTELLDYVSKIDGYKEARADLERSYSKLYDPSSPDFENLINDEVVAHVLGEKLGNQQFVNSLSVQKPSIARQIYNWVIDKLNSLNKITGYKSEKIFWEDVKNKFDNAYRSEYNSNQQINSTMYASQNIIYNNTRQDFTKALKGEEWVKFYKKIDNHGLESIQPGTKNTTIVDGKIIESIHDGQKPNIYNVFEAVETGNKIAENFGLTTEDIIQSIYEIVEEENVDERKIKRSLETYFKEGLLRRYDSNNNEFVGYDEYSRKNSEQNTKYSARGDERRNNLSEIKSNEELENSSFSNDIKQQQLDIINKSNPADDEIHTWIRSTDDIKTFEEAFFEDGEYSGMDPDFTEDMANDSLKSGEITIYSSYPIENGVFVSPSQMEASQYAGGDASKLYSKTVNINDVAWIDGAEGQYAKVESNTNNLITNLKDNEGRTLTKEQQDYFKNSKIVDQDKNLQVVYHTMTESKLPFHEFNPIGTKGYKFGNQVVNFFTNNKEMSGSYAENEYVKYNNESKSKDYYQYSGYINIENPYIIDANFSEWNRIPNDSNLKIKQNQKYININDVVKSVLEMNKNNSDYDGIIIKNVYDYATDYDIYENEAGNVYVTFNSNQFKNINNLKPTTSKDIRFFNKNNTWDEFTQNNFKTNGTGEKLQDVLLPTQKDINKVNLPTNEDINLRSLEETAPTVEKNDLGYIPQDPTRESSYDNEITDSIKETLADPITEFKRSLDREMEENIKSPKKIKENNDIKRKAESMWSDFQEKFVNRNYEIDKLAKQTKNREIMFKGDMLNSVAGETSGEINVAQTDNYGRRIGESLNSLFKNSKKKGYYEQFDDYLKHYSNIDRHGYGKGSAVPLEYSQKMVQAYEQSIPGIKNEATKVWQYGKNLLNNMEENGLISKELRGTLEELYPHYVPYMQSESMVPYMDDSGEIKPKKVIKRAKGGAHDLVTIEEAFERYTYATKKAIRQNDLYKEIVKTSKEKVSFGADDRIDPTQLDNSLMRDAEGNNYLTAYVDGTQQQAKISDNLYQELTKNNELKVKNTESKYSLILKPIQKISEVRRNILTTWNPSFILTNSMKDIQDGMFNSKYTKDMIKNYPSAFYELATQSTEAAQQFTSLYGSGMVMGEYQIDRLTNSTRNMDINQLNSIIKSLPNANEIVELAPRYAEFKASLQNGASVTEAMYNAREVTTNFNRGGYITKALNRNGFTFLNASVQGFDKMIRNLTGVNGTKGFVASTTGIMLKVTALGIAPAMFNAMSFNAGDDDEDEAYKALPDYIKDNYYLIKVKGLGNKTSKYYDGTFLRIPKGRMLSVFGSAARRTLEYSKGDKNAFDGYLKNVESQIGINNPEENNIIAPIKQAFGSKNGEAWYGGDLVPKRLQNKPVAEQYDEGTDEFSKWLGKMINVSPYKINYLLDQYSGGAGDIILPMITKETTNGATSVGDYLIAPVKDKFIVNSTDDNKYASKFYTKLETLQTKNNSDTVSTSDKLKYKYMSSISSDMSKLYKEKREIQLDDSLTKKQKYKKVQNVQKEINKLAEEGIKEPKIKDLKSHYVKVENTEYYKNSKGSWTAIKDEEASELNSLRMSANEKSNYFKTKNKIGAIRNSDIKSSEKKDKISNLIVNMNMSDDKLAYIYGKYYSNEETLDIIQNAGISIKEFIKYNSQDIESDYYANGKAVPNSKKKKTIAYINSLNLSAIQKAMLIRMEYSSFTSYDKQIIQYINNRSLNMEDKKEILTSLGFKIRNGRVYSK